MRVTSLKFSIQCRSNIRFHLHGGSIPPISTDKSKAPEWVLLLLAAGKQVRNRTVGANEGERDGVAEIFSRKLSVTRFPVSTPTFLHHYAIIDF